METSFLSLCKPMIPLRILTKSDQPVLVAHAIGRRLIDLYKQIGSLGNEAIADLGRIDRYYLFTTLLNRQ